MRAVFLGGLGHQADGGHASPIVTGLKAPLAFAVLDHGLDAGVAAVRDHGGVQFAGVPHLARVADRRHRGVDDHVLGTVGDAASSSTRPARAASCRPRLSAVMAACCSAGRLLDLGVQVADAVVGVKPACLSASACLASIPEHGHHAEDDGSETFIMVAFRCTENSTPLRGRRPPACRKDQAATDTDGVDDLAGLDRVLLPAR